MTFRVTLAVLAIEGAGAERPWSLDDGRGLVAGEAFEPESRFDAEVGYGFAVLEGRGVATPMRLGRRGRRRAGSFASASAFASAPRSET